MKQELEAAVAGVCKNVFGADVRVELTRPSEQFGDYATNVALQLAGTLRKPPREVAETLAAALRDGQSDIIQTATVAGPGFINLRLSDTALAVLAAAKPHETLAGKTVVVEYSDPNPFKPLHAGHLYTTLVGDTIARLVECAGARTVRINYGGDVGLHVAKSMWAILNHLGGERPEQLAHVPAASRAAWLGARYVEGNMAYENDAAARAEIIAVNKRVYGLHAAGDRTSPFAHMYWTCRQWSYDYFAALYEQLRVMPFDRYIPESEVTPLGFQTVKAHTGMDADANAAPRSRSSEPPSQSAVQNVGVGVQVRGSTKSLAVHERTAEGGRVPDANGQPPVFVRSNDSNAIIFPGERYGLHTRVFVNSEGLPTYETKDVGLSLVKWRDYHFDESIIITANEQAQYMQVVLAAIKQFAPEPAERTRHLTHGVVKLRGGVKISSRKGNGPSALDILDAARSAGQASGTNPSEETILAAVKYAFAKNRIGGDIVYDPNESIALEGNSGPYLQYAHARAQSIVRKANAAAAAAAGRPERQTIAQKNDTLELAFDLTFDVELDEAERSFLRKIGEYAETAERATAELLPHHICTYLYELAQTFNRFYEHNRVVGDPRQAVRLQLVERYAAVLRSGLGLLGISAPDRL